MEQRKREKSFFFRLLFILHPSVGFFRPEQSTRRRRRRLCKDRETESYNCGSFRTPGIRQKRSSSSSYWLFPEVFLIARIFNDRFLTTSFKPNLGSFRRVGREIDSAVKKSRFLHLALNFLFIHYNTLYWNVHYVLYTCTTETGL